MAVGAAAASPAVAVGHESAANGGGPKEGGEASPVGGVPGMRADGNRVAALVEGAPAGIAVEGDESEEEAEEEEEGEGDDDDDDDDAGDDDEGEKWLGLYSSFQSILLVGDGDFSFSLALATGFGSGANLVATSLDSYEALCKKFSRAEYNIMGLKSLGATVMHGIDVETMKVHTDIKNRRFDRIVYNFPHSGFKGSESEGHVINSHKKLVRGFFRYVRHLLQPYGEIHVSHKTGKPYEKWGIEHLAAEFSLVLVEKVGFRKEDYPGYQNKKGAGPNCDKPFPLGTCCTFKFKIGDLKKLRKQNGRSAGSISSAGGDTRPCHPLPLVQPLTGLQFVPSAFTVHMPMALPSHVVAQRQQPGIPLNIVGAPRHPYFHQQGSARSLLSTAGPSPNSLGTPGRIPSPMGRSTSLLAPQGHPRYENRISAESLVKMGTPGRIPSPMGRSTSLLAPQEHPRYEDRISAESLVKMDYFACEYQRSLLMEYWMQQQLMPEAATSLNYSAFLEARQWESVQREERLHRMIAYLSQ